MHAAAAAAAPLPRFDDAFLRRLERLSVVARRVAARGGRAERRTRRAGAGIEFSDHRGYLPGDDLRHLDWNLYARLDKPLVRVFEEDDDLPVYLLVDTSASMALGEPPKIQLALETSAALAYVALSGLDRVWLYPIADGLGAGVGPLGGKGQIHALLAALSSLRPQGRTSLAGAASAFVRRHRRRGLVVVISDFHDPAGWHEALDRLRHARFDAVVIQVVAPDEAAPNIRGEVTFVDVETGEERSVTVTPSVLGAYRARHAARLRALAAFCRERSVPCFQPDSATSFETLVLRVLRAGGVLR